MVSAAATPKKKLAEEMRMAAMELHKTGQAKEGKKEAVGLAIAGWEPTLEGYLNLLANSKLLYEALERIVEKASFPECETFS